jgi:hypothetical protein
MREVNPGGPCLRAGDNSIEGNGRPGSCIDFAGNAGTSYSWNDSSDLTAGYNRMFHWDINQANGPMVIAIVNWADRNTTGASQWDRAFRWRAQLTFSNVPDGLSNTVFLQEKWVYNGGMGYGDPNLLMSPRNYYKTGIGVPTLGYNTQDGSAYDIRQPYNFMRRGVEDIQRDANGTDGNNGYRSGSVHPSGLQALLGDGAVRMISWTTDGGLRSRLTDRRDRAKVEWEQLAN